MKFALRSLIAALLIVFSINSKAQLYLGLQNDNYSGITGISLNPAFIVDSRIAIDINLASVSAEVWNNQFEIPADSLLTWEFSTDAFISRAVNNTARGAIGLNIDGPGIMMTLSEKAAAAFTMSLRNHITVEQVTPDLMEIIKDGFNSPALQGDSLSGLGMRVNEMMWLEYGVTYGRELMDKGEHYLKGAARLKLTQGIASAYVNVEDLSLTLLDDSILSVHSSDITVGYNEEIDMIDLDSLVAEDFRELARQKNNFGLGMDIGVVYEWRPDHKQYLNPSPSIKWYRAKNKYKVRIGLSILDIGGVKFNNGQYALSFTGMYDSINVNNTGINDIDDFYDTMQSWFNASTAGATYRVGLPTALSLQADYHVKNGFYVNMTMYTALVNKKDAEHITAVSNYSFTPRYEWVWAGIAMPISVNSFGAAKLGLNARLGPVFAGVQNIGPWLGNPDVNGVQAHAGAKIILPYGRAKDVDTDNDGIPDRLDECPEVPGVEMFAGCPDTDKDSIPDHQDSCVTIPGPRIHNGCPDMDGDGIIDKYDDCPRLPGVPEFNGCPDRDGDGVQDKDDLCPDKPGPKNKQGCPDTDGDGVYDNEDDCPEVRGLRSNNGCPEGDIDGDGIIDKEDHCPEVPGPAENNGCPYTDSDNDGVRDIDDKCPNTPGTIENDGCPELKEEEKEILKRAFDNLEFETGKAVIRSSSYSSLDELAELMKANPEWKLRISGHTDNVGSEASNLTLSKNRANSTRDYLVRKGISADRFIVEWYGETKPIYPNDTPAGRQKNRRVEMEVVFE